MKDDVDNNTFYEIETEMINIKIDCIYRDEGYILLI